jgi:FKBP-type peptidyl-prolyl cis-trans isomerase
MRIVLAAGFALALAACGGQSTEATTETAAAPETPPAPEATTQEPAVVPASNCTVSATPPASGVSDTATWTSCTPWNSANPLVKKTGSGMEYLVIASGAASGVAPTTSQEAEVFYEGRLNAGGPAFDSAFQRKGTEQFPVAAVVPGFSEALQLMKPGDRWLVFIPSALGYGARGTPGGPIPPNADLVFEIEMVKIH